MKRGLTFLPLILILAIGAFLAQSYFIKSSDNQAAKLTDNQEMEDNLDKAGIIDQVNPLTIAALKEAETPGSDITVEQKLNGGSNYSRQVVSYRSDGLKIFALMTIPTGPKPSGGYPVIVFNHGYIPPTEYRTTEKYVAYQDAFARAGYITFKSDYRGHGSSEGNPSGAYGSNDYSIDVLNALASLKKHPDANPEKIGMWGHSMGGFITLRAMVVNKDIKAGSIWAGVVASHADLLNNWRRNRSTPPPQLSPTVRRWRDLLTEQFGTPQQNPEFWDSLSANSFLDDISGPVQLQHGTADSSVPYEFSVNLEKQLKEKGKIVELYTYNGDDHNISKNLTAALSRSVAFFDKYLKN